MVPYSALEAFEADTQQRACTTACPAWMGS